MMTDDCEIKHLIEHIKHFNVFFHRYLHHIIIIYIYNKKNINIYFITLTAKQVL